MGTWRPYLLLVLFGLWPQLGCHHLPADKSVKDVRQIQPKTGETPKKETSAAPVDQTPMAQAKALADAGKNAEAVAMYEKIRSTDQAQALHATKKLAALYLRHNELDRAEQEYQILAKYQPRDADVLCALGDISYRRGHFGIAEKLFRDALARQPDHALALVNLGMTLAQDKSGKKYDESVATFKRVHGSEAEALCEVAFIMKLTGKNEDAMRAYQAALSKEPGNTRARNELAQMYQADPSATVRLTTPYKAEKRGVVELEPTSPLLASEGTSRLMTQRPALPPAPDFDLEENNARAWQSSGQKK